MWDALFWSLILLLVGVGLIVLETFIPSGGILGLLAALALVGSLIVAFTGGPIPGLVMLVVTLVMIPALLAAIVKWWPYTPIGRMIVLHLPESEEEVLPDTPAYRGLKELIGRRGVAKTKMLPSGAILIDGRVYDAVSDGLAIDPGQPIRVKAVRTNRLFVTLDTAPRPEPLTESDLLSRPVETLGLDSLEEPPPGDTRPV
jgi:membrane-bound serine protease (ClpP class)